MPRDGALTLSDLRGNYLHINCGPCSRRGRYAVAALISAHGDVKLPDLLTRLADCPTARGSILVTLCLAALRKTKERHSGKSDSDFLADARERSSILSCYWPVTIGRLSERAS